MDLGTVDVRQISVAPQRMPQKLATVVTRSADETPLHRLLLINYDTATVVKRKDEITTAVFSADGKAIVAGKDSKEENLLVFDLSLALINSIKLSFPGLSEGIEVDDYRVFWVSEPHRNNYVVFASYFATEDDVEGNIGKTMMFWVGDELAKPGLTLATLKESSKIKACFWEFDH